MRDDSYSWPAGKYSAACFTVDVDAHSPWLWTHRRGYPSLIGHLEQRRFGPRVGIWRLLDLFARYDVKATLFVPGAVVESWPDLLPAFLAAGHEVGLHGYFHELVSEVSDEEFTVALEKSIELFVRQTGVKPAGFRSPAWEMTAHMLAELRRHGLYDSSLMGYDHPYTIDGVVEVPVQWTIDDAVHFKFLGGGADQWPPSAPGPILDGWLDEWALLHRYGSLFMMTVHDWISGRAQRIAMLERLIERVSGEESVWCATVGKVAAHHAATQLNRYAVTSAAPAAIDGHPARSRP